MSSIQSQVLVALNHIPVGTLKAIERAYSFSYFQEYLNLNQALPISLSYPLELKSWDHSFAGELPPYFMHLLPEGWLNQIAETSGLPMNTPLEKLATLCQENLGAVEIYETQSKKNLSYEDAHEEIAQLARGNDSDSLFETQNQALSYPVWNNCLRCHELLPSKGFNGNYHEECSLKFFGNTKAPYLNISVEKLAKVAREQLKRHESLTGVQPKFSAFLRGRHQALSDMDFIVKPEPAFDRPQDGISYRDSSLAELAAMHFAELLELDVAETALVYLNGSQPAIISKRFDRANKTKIHTEDTAQALSIRNKYNGSHEKIAGLIKKIASSEQRKIDLERFYKLTILNFIIGNADGHLKNFSFVHEIKNDKASYKLAPFYDLVPVLMFSEKDVDQLALTIEGRRNNIERKNFQALAIKLGLSRAILDDFTDEVEANLETFYEPFAIFGAVTSLENRLRTYCESQIVTLRKGRPTP